MSVDTRLRLVLLWHMHQPYYQEAGSGSYRLPWTYLHVIKDYVDMAAHLEAVPAARAVVNFAPTLLEQIDDYAAQVKAHLEEGAPIADPLLAALTAEAFPAAAASRMELARACLRANEERLINRFAPYRKLADIVGWFRREEGLALYLNDQFLADLLVWYHLAWLGESVRRHDDRVKWLMAKGSAYTARDRLKLMTVIGELLAGVLGRYRTLAERGQVELSVTPYAHPIAPLLLDLRCAREAMPEAPLPALAAYPGGEERTDWHIREGIAVFERHFGLRPQGCWPGEGSISDATLRRLEAAGFRWAASGEGVLRNSLHRAGQPSDLTCGDGLFHPYRLEEGQLACYFRDDGLSDLIGFAYSKWHADDAVGDFINHLENIANACGNAPGSVVSVILDGENAWEYYPENGYYFLSALYKRLAEHPRFRLTTFSACLDEGVTSRTLPHIVPGSWVYGTLSTWIGEKDKNRGWEMLGEAKAAFDRAVAAGRLAGKRLTEAERQLAICEGSDWFWWFGDYNPGEAVSDFEQLFRSHLRALYQLIGEAPPDYLGHAFTQGGGSPDMGGVMRPGKAS